MKPVQILNYKPSNVFEKTIAWANRGIYCHSAIVLNGILYESRLKTGVIKRIVRPDEEADVFIPKVPRTANEINAMIQFADAQVGKYYDNPGIVAFLTRATQENREGAEKWFCSELVYCIASKGNLLLQSRIEPFMVHPTMISWSPELERIES